MIIFPSTFSNQPWEGSVSKKWLTAATRISHAVPVYVHIVCHLLPEWLEGTVCEWESERERERECARESACMCEWAYVFTLSGTFAKELIRRKLTSLVTHSVPPVKAIAARWGELVIVSPKSGPRQGTKLHTPSGRPASRKILKTVQLERTAVLEGFHTDTCKKKKRWTPPNLN